MHTYYHLGIPQSFSSTDCIHRLWHVCCWIRVTTIFRDVVHAYTRILFYEIWICNSLKYHSGLGLLVLFPMQLQVGSQCCIRTTRRGGVVGSFPFSSVQHWKRWEKGPGCMGLHGTRPRLQRSQLTTHTHNISLDLQGGAILQYTCMGVTVDIYQRSLLLVHTALHIWQTRVTVPITLLAYYCCSKWDG